MKKTTRRALFLSFAAMFLCFTMLLGTTYAWFTDSVESDVNKIVAGNLDVELYNGLDTTATPVDGTTKLFDKIELWEPGAVVYENLTVANEGTLALKYQLGVEIAKANGTKDLSEVLKVAVVEDGITTDDRAALLASITNWQPMKSFIEEGKLEASTTSTPNTKTYGIVIYWEPSDKDNDYNMNNGKGGALELTIGVNLYATQLDAEDDSFGPDYDEDAWHEKFEVVSADALQAAINNGETNIVLVNDIEADESIVIGAVDNMSDADDTVVINLNGKTISGAGTDAEGNKIHTIVNYGTLVIKNGTVETVGNNGGSVIYNAEGATLIIVNVEIEGAPQGSNTNTWPSYAINNYGTMTINGADITSDHGAVAVYGDTVINDANITLNGRGGSSHVFYVGGEGTDLVINDGTYTHKGNVDGSLAYIMTGTTMTVNGGAFSASNGGYGLATYTGSLTVTGGTFANAFLDWGGPITISGGTFATKPGDKYIAEGYVATKNADGTYTVTFPQESFEDLFEGVASGATVEVPAGNFTMPAVGDVTITGTADTVIQLTTSTGNNVTLNGVTVVAGSYQGIQHSETVVFENCVIKGTQFLYANKVIFKNCTIDLSETADYIWTYSAKNVEFIDCVFNTKGKAILMYNEGPDLVTNVTVKGCTFNATASEGKAAIEIDSHYAVNGRYTLTTENNKFDSEHFTSEWRIKNGATNNTTVNGVTYTYVADGLYKGADNTYYVYDANGLEKLNAMMNDDTAGKGVVVNLLNDIDFAGKTWTPVDSHIDFGFYLKEINGNGHTISNLTVNGQAMFARFSCGAGNDVVIKDITFDGAKVNSNGNINTAIIVGHTYNNLLLDNVDVKNSSVTGGYKVATLVGTVYNESASAITLTVKNCDVDNCTVTTTMYDFMTCGLVAFVYVGDNDSVEFENTTISNVALVNTNAAGYNYHAFVYYNDQDTNDCFNEAEGVTVSGCTFENK